MGKIIATRAIVAVKAARIKLIALTIGLFMSSLLFVPLTAQASGTLGACSTGACHGNPPVDNDTSRDATSGTFKGSHNTHTGAWYTTNDARYGLSCEICHVAPNYTWNSHQGDTIQVNIRWMSVAAGVLKTGSVAGWGSYSKGTSFARSNNPTFGVCTNTYCHSNGSGGTQNAGAGGDSRLIAANISPMWSTNTPGGAGCTPCHGNETGNPGNGAPWYTSTWNNGTVKANSHQAHAASGDVCYKCHFSTTNTGNTITSVGNHIKGTYSVSPGTGISYTYTYTTNGGTCATISCHGGGSMKWGTGSANCIGCHSAAFPKNLGGAGTIRNVAGAGGDFTMASRHLRSVSTITKWDCMVCHLEGDASTGKAGTDHNDGSGASGGKVNVRNVDNWSTGWAIDNRAWTTTDYTNLDQFCLNCHDSDGASQIAVTNTNNGLMTGTWSTIRTGSSISAALYPFNSAWVTAGVVSGSTQAAALTRSRVTDVKTQFNPGGGVIGEVWTTTGANYNGNPSQHAVIGARYSTINTNWTAAAWSSFTLHKTGDNVNTTRETSLLSCADCHVLDSGSGAHGGANSYNLQYNTINSFCYVCHAQTTYRYGTTGGTGGSRYAHGGYSRPHGAYTAYGMGGGSCMLCHGGWSSSATQTYNQAYGGIHGSWGTYQGGMVKYRFQPGTYRGSVFTNNDGWSTTNQTHSCYFINGTATSAFNNCNSHSGSVGTYTPAYGRPTKY